MSGAALLCTRCRRFTLHFNLTKTGQRTNKNYIPVFTSLKLFNSYQAFKIDNKFGDFNNNLILKMSRLISDYRPLCGQTFRRRYHCHEKIFQKGKIQIHIFQLYSVISSENFYPTLSRNHYYKSIETNTKPFKIRLFPDYYSNIELWLKTNQTDRI